MVDNKTLLNFVLFQVGWWGTFFSAVHGLPLWVLAVFILGILGVHFLTSVAPEARPTDGLFFILVATIGYLGDSLWQWLALFQFSSDFLGLAPLWLIGMWLTFPMAIGHSFSWLEGRWLITFVFAGVGAPLCYRFGETRGLIRFESVLSMALYGLYWGILLNVIVWLKQHAFFRPDRRSSRGAGSSPDG